MPSPMSLLSWNCCSLGPSATIQELKRLVAKYHPQNVFLSEIRCSRAHLEDVGRQAGFDRSFVVHGVGTGGGLGILWQSSTSLVLYSYCHSHIDVGVALGSGLWRFSGFYGNPRRHLRHLSWDLLCQLASRHHLP